MASIAQQVQDALAGPPELPDLEPGFDQKPKRYVNGPGCWVRDKPDLMEPCKTILDGGTEVQCVPDTAEDFDGIERVKIFSPVDGWVARNCVSVKKTEKAPRPTARPRILCLHGARGSAKLFEAQFAAVRKHIDADLFFVDAPVRNSGGPDARLKAFSPNGGDAAKWKVEPNFSWWTGTRAIVSDECFQVAYDALCKFECDAVLGFGPGAAVACQLPSRVDAIRFIVLVASANQDAISWLDANCPTLHIYKRHPDPWAVARERLSYIGFKVRPSALHDEADAVPRGPEVYKVLNQFMAEFVGGYESKIVELY